MWCWGGSDYPEVSHRVQVHLEWGHLPAEGARPVALRGDAELVRHPALAPIPVGDATALGTLRTRLETRTKEENDATMYKRNNVAYASPVGHTSVTSTVRCTRTSHGPEDAWKWSSESSGSQDDQVAPARRPSSQRTLGRRSANAVGLRPSRSKTAKAPYGPLGNKEARSSEETVESLLRSRQRRESEITTRFEPLASTQQGVSAPPSTQQSTGWLYEDQASRLCKLLGYEDPSGLKTTPVRVSIVGADLLRALVTQVSDAQHSQLFGIEPLLTKL
ncbi:hypothetical protein EAI_15392 [Harpegnathos saltator]|uniref:Uncharacterized protein n=1 Tax=Harpegnathos saltator TaxID=610380 RepID=E2BSF5_HARSA|nr:hypothetical protein EAI_15392 [Harpegnathos saltator]